MKMKSLRWSLLFVLLLYSFSSEGIEYHPDMSAGQLFKDAVRGHPRIYLSASVQDRIKDNIKRNPDVKKAAGIILDYADQLLDAGPVEYKKAGKRMLKPARETLERVKYFGLAYYLSDQDKYAQAAIGTMLDAAKIPSWNPKHFLDTAELSFALGLGYDWFYHQMTDEQRETVLDAIVSKGIKPSMGKKKSPSWATSESNWNQVCNGGLGIAALAIWEEKPKVSLNVLKRAFAGIPYAMKAYAPDGIYPEGPSYWAYGTKYAVQFLDALNSVMGSDFGLSAYPGFMDSARTINYLTGPGGKFFNYSDGYRSRYAQPVTYWFADRLEDPTVLFFESQLMQKALEKNPGDSLYPDLPMYLIWNRSEQKPEPPQKLCWKGDGVQPMATLRRSWDDSAVFAGMKGGGPFTSHAHIDIGSFVLDAQGVRWISDVPSQSYSIAEEAEKKAEAEGRDFEPPFYRERWSHNILLVDDQKQDTAAVSSIVGFSGDSRQPNVMFDLSPAYTQQLQQVKRGMYLYEEESLVVQDELKTMNRENTHIRWAALTYTDVTLIDDRTIRMDASDESVGTGSRKTMVMKLLSPEDARFEVLTVNDQKYIHSYDRMPENTKQIVINLDLPAQAETTISVYFKPGRDPARRDLPDIIAMEKWIK
ncbi:MAG: heparinase II/III family protein [Kiritimatiellales bacterium]